MEEEQLTRLVAPNRQRAEEKIGLANRDTHTGKTFIVR